MLELDSCAVAALVGCVTMPALDLCQCPRIVESVVEVRVQMVGLMRENRTKRTAIGRKTSVPLVHVVAVCDRGGDGTIRGGRNARLNTGSILPTRGVASVAKCACSLSILTVYESEHGLFHIAVVRWAEGFDQLLPVPL